MIEMSYLIKLLYFMAHLVNLVQNSYDCGPTALDSTKGVILSPDYSTANNSEINCSWTIHSNHNVPFHLKINYLDIASCESCCNTNYLKISNEHRELARYCSNREGQDVVLKENIIILDFRAIHYTNRNKGIRLEFYSEPKMCSEDEFKCFDNDDCIEIEKICNTKFDCQDHSDEVNCKYCNVGLAACDYASKHCFNPFSQRCDGIVDCPGGEDETNCTNICPERLQCGHLNYCYDIQQHCNGVIDCINGYDEKNCSHLSCGAPFNIKIHFICRNGKCINRLYLNDGLDDCGDGSDEFFTARNTNYIVLASFVGIFMSIIFIFLVCRWFMTRRNVNYLMANPPDFPRRLRRDCDNPYQEQDFRRGGVIYEAYMQSRRDRVNLERRGRAEIKSNTQLPLTSNDQTEATTPCRDPKATIDTKRNVESQKTLEKMVFGNFAQQKDSIFDSSDASIASNLEEDELSLGDDFSPALLMGAHEGNCLICKSQNTSDVKLVNPREIKSEDYLLDSVHQYDKNKIPSRCKSESSMNATTIVVSNLYGIKKDEAVIEEL